MRLKDKVALITGAGSGIGAAFAVTAFVQGPWSERLITIYIPIRTVALRDWRHLFRWVASQYPMILLRG